MAITSKEINLQQLDIELGAKGLIADFNNPNAKIILPCDDSDVTEQELEAAIVNHIAQPLTEPTVEDKLASVGLNLEDLRAAILGGN